MLKGTEYLNYSRKLNSILANCKYNRDTHNPDDIFKISGYSSHTQTTSYYYSRKAVLAERDNICAFVQSLNLLISSEQSVPGILGVLPYESILKEGPQKQPFTNSTTNADHLFNLMAIGLIGYPIPRTSDNIKAGGIFLLDPELSNEDLVFLITKKIPDLLNDPHANLGIKHNIPGSTNPPPDLGIEPGYL